MYNILRIVILVVSYYVLRCMYCILCYLITKLTCSIEEPLCGNAIKSLLLLLLFLKYFNLFRFMLIYLDLLDIFVPLPFVYQQFLAYFWLLRCRLFIYSFYF